MSSSQEEHDVSHSKSKRFVDSILKKKKKVTSGKPKHIGDDEIEIFTHMSTIVKVSYYLFNCNTYIHSKIR